MILEDPAPPDVPTDPDDPTGVSDDAPGVSSVADESLGDAVEKAQARRAEEV